MNQEEQRTVVRYEDFARINAPDICIFPGVLVDVSETGCRVRFPVSITLDYEMEYVLVVQPSCKQGLQPFNLTVKPVWLDNVHDASEAGFSIICSSDFRRMSRYLEVLERDSVDSDELFLQELCL